MATNDAADAQVPAARAPRTRRTSGTSRTSRTSPSAPLLAYVLHRWDWSETSLIVELFTREQGRVVVAAKGAKRPTSQLRPVLLPFQPLHALLGKAPADEAAEVLNLRGAEWVGGRRTVVTEQVPAVVAGELAFAVGHEGRLLRPHCADEAHQVVERVALDVVFGGRPVLHQRGQLVYVLAPDVAFVGARVHGDAVGTRLQAQRRGLDDARNAQVARIAQQRDLVDVDRQRGAFGVAGAGFGSDERVHRMGGCSARVVRRCTPCQTRRVRSWS
jgi:hypothetical protein